MLCVMCLVYTVYFSLSTVAAYMTNKVVYNSTACQLREEVLLLEL